MPRPSPLAHPTFLIRSACPGKSDPIACAPPSNTIEPWSSDSRLCGILPRTLWRLLVDVGDSSREWDEVEGREMDDAASTSAVAGIVSG